MLTNGKEYLKNNVGNVTLSVFVNDQSVDLQGVDDLIGTSQRVRVVYHRIVKHRIPLLDSALATSVND